MGLLLEAVDAAGPLTWRWVLCDEESGNPLADHPVRLDADAPDLLRFSDLYGYERAYAAPDRRIEDGARFARLAGQWAGRELLGERVGAAILAQAPVTVRVKVPAVLDRVLLWPLELAHADGGPLAAQGDVTFVYDIAPDVTARRKAEGGTELRMLAVFSQPSRTSVLALRRERHALTRLIRAIAARERARIELRVVQYGVTRGRLERIADDGDGWDVLHLSGHGTGGVLLLEQADGTPDPVHVDDLVRLLRPARRRVRLAVVSACESAADATAQTLRLLGLTERAEQVEAADAEAARADAVGADATGAEAARADAAGADATGVDAHAAGTGAGEGAARGQGARTGGHGPAQIPGLARALVRELDCAVVAMRYPVADEFAIAYGDAFYEHLFTRRQPADLAAAKALAEAAGRQPTAARPPLSLATPGLFGARAAGLRLPVPAGTPDIDPAGQRLAYFPPEPPRFVGRAAAMAQASAALAPRSGRTAVLLHGMAGAGKTACALELAYRHAGSFGACAWWQAPTRDEEWVSALADFANRMDIQLADYGFTMAGHIGTVAALDAFLPRLRAAMAANGVLLVLDNLETLLTADGTWRDERWARLITALTGHDGESRVILTTRIAPAGLVTGLTASRAVTLPVAPASLVASRAVTLPVHALSLEESVALARELPNLRALLHADAGPVRDDDETPAATAGERAAGQARDAAGTGPGRDETPAATAGERDAGQARATAGTGTGRERAEAARRQAAADRDRVRRVLRVVQGHPKLLELADAAAVGRGRLDRQLAAAERAVGLATAPGGTSPGGTAPGGTAAARELDAFFRDGETTLDPEGFLAALGEWTRTALTALSPQARLMAGFIACLEDTDRNSDVIEATWPHLWRRLQAPNAEDAGDGDPPAPGPPLRELASAALTEAEQVQVAGAGEQPGTGTAPAAGDGDFGPLTLRMHPGVAAAIAAAVGPGVREAVDAELAAYWEAVSDWARNREDGEVGALVVRAGLAAAPYLLRQEQWRTASVLLEHAVLRDESPGLTQAVLPSLRRIAAATGAPAEADRLASVLVRVDPAAAERLLRGALDAAVGAGDYRVASVIAGDLGNLLLVAGRLEEALEVAGQKPELTRRAGLGPWTQLLDQGRLLQVLGLMGDHAQVLAEVDRLRTAMADLPARRGQGESVDPWNVRETVLDVAHTSALATGDWARCLELNAEIVASKRDRGAGIHEITRFRFNDAVPLIRLVRMAKAGRLLTQCQRVFEDHADTAMLAMVLSIRADLEASLGRPGSAVDLERAALRLSYARPEPRDIAISHHNLALYLGRLGGDRAARRAHRLAAALICRLTGMSHDLAGTVRALAAELREAGGADPSLPSTVTQVIAVAEQTEGVRLAALLAALQPDPRAVEAALADILRTATELPPDDGAPDITAHVGRWEPVIADIAATCQAGQAPPPELTGFLDEQAGRPDWAALVTALRRVLAGERGEPALLDGLDEIDAAIVRETLSRIAREH